LLGFVEKDVSDFIVFEFLVVHGALLDLLFEANTTAQRNNPSILGNLIEVEMFADC